MRKYFILALLTFVFNQSLFASAYGKVSSGNSLYKKNEFDQSLDKYREAQISAPDNPIVYYNIGNALNKTGKYDESDAEYSKALNTKDKLMRSKAYYNMGNNAFAQGKPDEALNYYKKCLDLNPKDMDAKYNIEYILSQKNMPKQKQNNKDGKDNKDKNKDRKQQNSKSKEDKSDKDKKNSMSKEDAQRILQYYDEQEKRGADKRKMNTPEQPKTDEDW
jgi:Ca-activated chloride channel homolog